MIVLVLLGLLAWGLIFYHLDRPSIAAWRVRDAYRITSLILFLLLMGCLIKLTAYRTELRSLVAYCR